MHRPERGKRALSVSRVPVFRSWPSSSLSRLCCKRCLDGDLAAVRIDEQHLHYSPVLFDEGAFDRTAAGRHERARVLHTQARDNPEDVLRRTLSDEEAGAAPGMAELARV